VAPSVRPEAFGRVGIEAQASSKIIVATKIGGALETVIDEETGFLIEPFDTEAMAKAIDKILEMPKEEIDKFGLAGRKNVEDNFSNDLMCQKTIEVYKKLLTN
jgi:glycosyltransferase involved in cell wall biosynthesis